MTATTHAGITDTIATPAGVGAKYIRWGLGLFVFGLVIGFVPLAHYMHGSFEPVGEAFLKNVTLWWGCAFTLAVYVAQVGSLAMIDWSLLCRPRAGRCHDLGHGCRANSARSVRGRHRC